MIVGFSESWLGNSFDQCKVQNNFILTIKSLLFERKVNLGKDKSSVFWSGLSVCPTISNGDLPANISNIRTPSAHQSTLESTMVIFLSTVYRLPIWIVQVGMTFYSYVNLSIFVVNIRDVFIHTVLPITILNFSRLPLQCETIHF